MKIRLLCIILLSTLCVFQAVASESETVQVRLITNQGDIELTLDPVNAPVTVENFLSYVDEGFYDGLIFHRVIPNFMIQGGGSMQTCSVEKPKHRSSMSQPMDSVTRVPPLRWQEPMILTVQRHNFLST